MKPWNKEAELFEMAKNQLFSAVIGDVMDQFGYRKQFLPAAIRPVSPEMIIAGKIMTVLGADAGGNHLARKKGPYGLLFEALDALRENDVFVYTGGTPAYAIWGGLMSTRAKQLRSAGAVVDGCYRDTREILELQFPTFGRVPYGPDQQSRGLIIDYQCSIQIGDVPIENGDFIFGDMDGVVVIPKDIAEKVFIAAFEKSNTENKIKTSLLKGMSATEAFDKYGIF